MGFLQRLLGRGRQVPAPEPTVVWPVFTYRISQGDVNLVYQMPPFLSSSFYLSAYGCPECGLLLYKTAFPEGFPIDTPEGRVTVPRAFTCPKCRSFYVLRPGTELRGGDGYVRRGLTAEEWQELFARLSRSGAAQARQGA